MPERCFPPGRGWGAEEQRLREYGSNPFTWDASAGFSAMGPQHRRSG